MALTVEPPEPPDLTNRGPPRGIEPEDAGDSTSDLRRGELEEMLADGAWAEAFREWAAYTDVTEAEYRTLERHELVQQLDLYWDPTEERLRFEVPEIPETLSEDAEFRNRAGTELSDLGQTVVEMLQDGYIEWGGTSTESDVEATEEETVE